MRVYVKCAEEYRDFLWRDFYKCYKISTMRMERLLSALYIGHSHKSRNYQVQIVVCDQTHTESLAIDRRNLTYFIH